GRRSGRTDRVAYPGGDRNPDPQPVAGVLGQARTALGALVDVIDVVGDRPLELALDLDQSAVGPAARRRRGLGRGLRIGLRGRLLPEHALEGLDDAPEDPRRLPAPAGLRTHLDH